VHKGRHGSDPLALDPETMRELGYRTIDLLVERLLRDVPRTATVTARTTAASTHSARPASSRASARTRATREADRLVHERVSAPQATIAP
jgi:hypothetical protein